MNIPPGFTTTTMNKQDYALLVHKNIYGQVQAGRVRYNYLSTILLHIGFKKCKRDECIFTRCTIIYVLYTDDSIIAGPNKQDIDDCIEQMWKQKLKITIEGYITDFLGVTFSRDKQDLTMTQTHLINTILKELNLTNNDTKIKTTPMASRKILSWHLDSPKFDNHFHYLRIIGMLNYLEWCTRPDIAYTTHQCARFCEDPRTEHGNTIRWSGRYLHGTKDKGINATIKDEAFTVYVDADFANNWDDTIATFDRDTERFRHGYIITYLGISIAWASQLQTEISLRTTESEYIGLPSVLRRAFLWWNCSTN